MASHETLLGEAHRMRNSTAPVLGPAGLEREDLVADRRRVTIFYRTVGAGACCPVCGLRSVRVHSRYERAVADLPWHGVPVTLRLRVRRFFCDAPSCERAIFAERLPEIAAHARETARLQEALTLVALELGGEAGSRLARELGLPVSPDTLLRRARAISPGEPSPVRVLGVDE
jgi:hypothetical protein